LGAVSIASAPLATLAVAHGGWTLVAQAPPPKADLIVVFSTARAGGMLEAGTFVKAGFASRVRYRSEGYVRQRSSCDAGRHVTTEDRTFDSSAAQPGRERHRGAHGVVGTWTKAGVQQWCAQIRSIRCCYQGHGPPTPNFAAHPARVGSRLGAQGVRVMGRYARCSKFDLTRGGQSSEGQRGEIMSPKKLVVEILRHRSSFGCARGRPPVCYTPRKINKTIFNNWSHFATLGVCKPRTGDYARWLRFFVGV